MIIGKKICYYRTLDSTSTEARRLIAGGAGEGLVVVAGQQTRGRGKPGSRWFSPAGNLYFSAVVKPFKNPQELAPITLLGALAARAVIGRLTRLPIVIKWPNDLQIGGRKVGGVLTERLPSGHLIIGIGLNLNTVPAAVKRTAVSLRQLTGKKYGPRAVASRLRTELDKEYKLFLKSF
jgi:BirA family biotin operon repressor/biotin-[acetyl-CoA-carboxylase] ligase